MGQANDRGTKAQRTALAIEKQRIAREKLESERSKQQEESRAAFMALTPEEQQKFIREEVKREQMSQLIESFLPAEFVVS